mmetsp:Transcript_5702/g.16357  ORF Transcript_5702/g.16357 Transcript_5702/m.16357 type:complete len:241 (+) Transcript_5702:90-812(+)
MSSPNPSPPKKQKHTLDKRDLTDDELKRYAKTVWPAKPVGNVKELAQLIECQFFQYPDGDGDDEDEDDDDEPDTDTQWKNFSAYVRKVGGFGWINALHDFDGGDDDDDTGDNEKPVLHTALTYVLDREPEEWRFVTFLLQMGADPNVRNSRGETPLFVFMNGDSMMKRLRTFSLLMDAGACDKAVYGGKTMIQFAKIFKDNDQVSQMIWEDFSRKYGLSSRSSGPTGNDSGLDSSGSESE